VIVLDENIFEDQRARLRLWRIHLCQIGPDVGRKGMPDDEIMPLLRTMRRPTFVTWDSDFFDKTLCSDRFCLAYLDVRPLEVAEYVRRLLRHPEFRSWSQRKGCVVRVSTNGITAWRAHAPRVSRHRWVD
jgi:hypothetical protein